MSKYQPIAENEMREFLGNQGFSEVKVDRCQELVMGKVVRKGNHPVCVRVYTSISHGAGREVGEDAIRVVLVTKDEKAGVVVFGKSRRVYRVEGWKANLQNRLDSWDENLGPQCPKCGGWMALRKGKNGEFWGCSLFRATGCKGSANVEEE
jgi:hypothetical protein